MLEMLATTPKPSATNVSNSTSESTAKRKDWLERDSWDPVKSKGTSLRGSNCRYDPVTLLVSQFWTTWRQDLQRMRQPMPRSPEQIVSHPTQQGKQINDWLQQTITQAGSLGDAPACNRHPKENQLAMSSEVGLAQQRGHHQSGRRKATSQVSQQSNNDNLPSEP